MGEGISLRWGARLILRPRDAFEHSGLAIERPEHNQSARLGDAKLTQGGVMRGEPYLGIERTRCNSPSKGTCCSTMTFSARIESGSAEKSSVGAMSLSVSFTSRAVTWRTRRARRNAAR